MLNLDTHIILSFLDQTLTNPEIEIMSKSQEFYISDIVLWEISMLKSKKRIIFDFDSPEWKQFSGNIRIVPISQEIAIQSTSLDFKTDPSDHLIAATSIVHNIPLLTRDKNILQSKMTPFA